MQAKIQGKRFKRSKKVDPDAKYWKSDSVDTSVIHSEYAANDDIDQRSSGGVKGYSG